MHQKFISMEGPREGAIHNGHQHADGINISITKTFSDELSFFYALRLIIRNM